MTLQNIQFDVWVKSDSGIHGNLVLKRCPLLKLRSIVEQSSIFEPSKIYLVAFTFDVNVDIKDHSERSGRFFMEKRGRVNNLHVYGLMFFQGVPRNDP